MNERINDCEGAVVHSWIRTFSRARIFITRPERSALCGDIQLSDIAHALSQICRFGGHTRCHYSVAQHSVLASLAGKRRFALRLLLHDAPETYMGDLVSPLKAETPSWKPLENRWANEINLQFGLWPSEEGEAHTKAVDLQLLGRELIDLVPGGVEDAKCVGYREGRIPAALRRIRPWGRRKAKRLFLRRFRELTGTPTLLDRLFPTRRIRVLV